MRGLVRQSPLLTLVFGGIAAVVCAVLLRLDRGNDATLVALVVFFGVITGVSGVMFALSRAKNAEEDKGDPDAPGNAASRGGDLWHQPDDGASDPRDTRSAPGEPPGPTSGTVG